MCYLKLRNTIKKLCFYCFASMSVHLYGQDLVTAWSVNAGVLNPHLYSPNQMYAQVLVYESLVRYHKDGSIQPAIASSWDITNSGKTYTFHIPKNQFFSDGSTLDAYVVEKNFRAILANKKRHAWLGITEKIKDFKAKNATTFELNLVSPYVATLEELSLPRPYRILSPNGFKEDNTSLGISKPIGSGAWILEKSKLGEYDIFIPNPHFRGKKSAFKRLIVKVLPDANARVLALKSGAIDMLLGEGSISLENFARFQRDSNFKAEVSDIQGTSVIAINAAKNKITADKNVRAAIVSAFNKEAVIRGILLNIQAKADFLFNPSLPFANQGLSVQSYNPALSKTLLEESGWVLHGKKRIKNNKPLELDLIYIGTDPIQKAIAEVLQANLAAVGITLYLKASEQVSFYQAQKDGNFDLIFNQTWGNPFDPHSFLSSMRQPSHADFMAQRDLPNKPQIDRAINEILNTNDKKTLDENYHFVLNALQDSNIYLPINYQHILAVYNKHKMKNFEFGAMKQEFMFHLLEPVR